MNQQTTAEVGSYFDALYGSLSNSSTHQKIGREALGDGFVGQLGYAGLHELYRLAELTGLAKGNQVLDLCCGMGGSSLWFARQLGVKVTGLDCSSVGVGLGKHNARGVADIGFVQGDIKYLPFLHHSFDAIVSLDGFGSGFADVFQQCFRILRPGGSLAFLLNIPLQSLPSLQAALDSTGFVDIRCHAADESTVTLMQNWLDCYHTHRRAHIREVGRQYHQALTGEIAELLEQFRQERMQRFYLSAFKAV